MNRLILRAISLLLLLCPISIIAQSAKTVTIKGVLKNFSNQVKVEDMSETQYLLPPNAERIVIPDAEGKFKITFKIASPNYFRIGRNILYLTPGDNLTVILDKENYLDGDFKGKGSQANMFLRGTPFPKAGSYLEAGRKVKPNAKETIDSILETARLRQKELVLLKGITAEFKRLEAARIKADTINSLLAGNIYSPKLPPEDLKIYMAEYKKLSEEEIAKYQKNFVDASLMKLVVYRDVVKHLLKYSSKQADIKKITDWLTATSLVNSMNKLSDKSELKKFDSQISAIGTIGYRNAVKLRLEELLKLGKGDPAIDFTAVDIKGNPVSLASLKGKVIYLDLWATWCGPCVYEKPFFAELQEKYKDNDKVAFVSLSIDDDTELWKQDVDKRKADGHQWLINRNSLLDYNIIGVPRSIIIDKDFKIADLNAPHPSSKDTEKVIEALLK
jgi:thiol-disulfide isomerase/thioredoxin